MIKSKNLFWSYNSLVTTKRFRFKSIIFYKTFSAFFLTIWMCTGLFGQNIVYYFSDFENNDGGLKSTGSWERFFVSSGPGTAFSDFFCWGTNLDGPYPDDVIETLDTPVIDLTGATSAQLTFWHWYEFEADGDVLVDGGNVKISINGGPFEVIIPFRDYDGKLNNNNNPMNGEPVFSSIDVNRTWEKVRINLHKFIGQTVVIRFEMASDATVNYAGWYMDDLAVNENQRDAAILSIETPLESVDFNLKPFTPLVTVYNACSEILNFDVNVKMFSNDREDYHSVKSVTNLEGDQIRLIEFDPWSPSQTGSYQYQAYTSFPSDNDPTNDTLNTNLVVFSGPFSNVTFLAGLDVVKTGYYSLGDYDNDGFIDLYLSGKEVVGESKIFKNSGNGRFYPEFELNLYSDLKAGSGHWGDYDRDGDLDLFIRDNMWDEIPSKPGSLFRNDQDIFTDVTENVGFINRDSGTIPQAAVWIDYDNDGKLDLFVIMNSPPNHLYHNLGDGTFEEIASPAGVANIEGFSVLTADYNDDGFTDLLIYRHLVTALYRNKGDGTFEPDSRSGITNQSISSAAFADYDNDGKLDLLFGQNSGPGFLYHNNGDGTFTDVVNEAGLGGVSDPTWADYNNDGFLDLFDIVLPYQAANGFKLFHNNGDGTFALVDNIPEFNHEPISRLAPFDYDSDGDLDLFINIRFNSLSTFLFRNNISENNWLGVKLSGNQNEKNGFGARLRLKAGDISQVRQINGRTNNLPVHFGLGREINIDTLEVVWPNGIYNIFTNIQPNQYITIEEDSVNSYDITPVPKDFTINNYPNPFRSGTNILFRTKNSGRVLVSIYNLLGQRVRVLMDQFKDKSTFDLFWDGKNDFGYDMPDGIYFIRTLNEQSLINHKIILIR